MGELAGFEVSNPGLPGYGRVRLRVRSFSANPPSAPSLCLPEVVSAVALSPTTVRVRFDSAMMLNAALVDPANYVLAAAPGSVVRNVIDVDAPEECGDPTYVVLTLDGEMTIGVGNYTVTVSNVQDAGGDFLDPAANSAAYNGVGVQPLVTMASATIIDLTKVRVTFTEAVKQVAAGDPDDALNPANYVIVGGPGPVVVNSVASIGPLIVDLDVAGLVADVEYELTPSNIVDLAGNVIG